jgi:hypothetical protein
VAKRILAYHCQSPDSKTAARRGGRVLNEDGLVDIALGVGLLFAALYLGLDPTMRIRLIGLAVLVPVLIVLVLGAVRRRWVHPRVGKALLPTIGAMPGVSIILTALFFVGLMALLIVQRPGQGTTSPGLVWLLRGLLVAAAALLFVLGLLTGLARFRIHAGVIALSVLGAGLFLGAARASMIVMAAVPGAVLFTTGIAAFARFLRKYRVPVCDSHASTTRNR